MVVANGTASNVTAGLIMKDEWNRISNVPVMRATRLGGAYFAFGSARPGFTQVDTWQQDDFVQLDDFAGARSGIVIDPTNARVALNVTTSEDPMTNIFSDAWSGETILIRDAKVYRLNIADETGPRQPYIWRSKIFQVPDKKNFAVVRVYFKVPPWAPAQNPVRNQNNPQTLAADQYGLIRIYADEQLVMTRELRTSGELMRMPSGFKADYWQIEFEANVQITSAQMASSVKELMKV
jgi:hypothetical protein